MKSYRWAVLLGVLLFAGCGGDTTSVTPPSPGEEARIELVRIADTGMVDSTVFLLRDDLEEMKDSDAATAESLLSSLDELEQLKDRERIKELASEMIATIDASSGTEAK